MDTLPGLIAIFSPLLAAGLIALLGSSLGERTATIGIRTLALSTPAAVLSLYQATQSDPLRLVLPGLPEPLAPILLVDRLAAVMMVLITGVSLVIHVYSRRYMQGDQGFVKFFGLLSLLTFVLLALVTSGHLLWLFVAWHAVTWLLRTLLAFNRQSLAARLAGRTTLRVQGLGDAALLAAIVMIYSAFGTFDLAALFARIQDSTPLPIFGAGTWWEIEAVTAITLCMILSVMTKSAQFPFHIWLPGTIEAPTPVSAMLHAGIVNAGGFLVNRLAPLYGTSPTALYVLFVVGALTALIGASTMLTQSSIKRTLVYSTMGQMGYMVMECGLGAFSLAVFHLIAHGLFKATVFLNCGNVIGRARQEPHFPHAGQEKEEEISSRLAWFTGFVTTLLIPLLMLLLTHGILNIPLLETQGTVIFLFFIWVTSSQAILTLTRLRAVSSWQVSLAMLLTLLFVVFVYLFAVESFTSFLYPNPDEVAAYFKAAELPGRLFDMMIGAALLTTVLGWCYLYLRAQGRKMGLPAAVEGLRIRLYVLFLNRLYVEEGFQRLRDLLLAAIRYFNRPPQERIL